MLNYRITISGRVQGVGFRWSVYQLAQQLGVSGFVRNLPTGQVYIEAQGDSATLDRFTDRLAAGPTPYAKVSRVDKVTGPCQDYGHTFTIRR